MQHPLADAALRLSVVVPAKNEAQNIAPLVEELADVLAPFAPFEVIYVDDGSTDGTSAELQRLRQLHPWLRQIRHARSAGQSAAVRTGVRASRAAVVATLDADGQNDPAFIPKLLAALEAQPGAGLAAGQRVGRKDTGFKRLQSRIANAVRGAILNDGTRDSGCGLKCFRRDAFLALPYFDAIHRFLPALMRREGHGIVLVDIVDRPRRHGQSNYTMWKRLLIGLVDLMGVWWLIRRMRPAPQATEIIGNSESLNAG
jgi:glycosyltransferase involved in cell wall biosynthesis